MFFPLHFRGFDAGRRAGRRVDDHLDPVQRRLKARAGDDVHGVARDMATTW
jgi:hypothetical protein